MFNISRNNNSKLESIDKIISGMEELLLDWDVNLDENYPFNKSLDELLVDVTKWRSNQAINNK